MQDTPSASRSPTPMRSSTPAKGFLSWLNLTLFGLAVSLVPLMAFVFRSPVLAEVPARLLLAAISALAGAFFFQAATARRMPSGRLNIWTCLAVSLTFSASLYILFSYLPEISNSPFTLTWSEASRYYYASLFFSERIYSQSVPPTVLHPSRYLLQSVPFLIPDAPIWIHRAWQALLWITAPLATAYLLARRLAIKEWLYRWLFIGSAFLFILTGPIYYHLLVPVFLVLLGFRTGNASWKGRRWYISLIAVFAASAWAGISRVNWFPLPGCLAAMLILLESPIQVGAAAVPRIDWPATGRYLLRLAGWVVFGTAIAFLSQLLYIAWSGNSAEQFATSFSSSLLWHRLLPSQTYPLGILPAISLVCLPLALVVLGRLLQPLGSLSLWRRISPFRLLGMLGILLVFFLGGLLVSVKIGGGSNIHNMDAFMALFLVNAAYFLFERARPDLQPDMPAEIAPEALSSERGHLAIHRTLVKTGLTLGFLIFPLTTFLSRPPAGPPPDPADLANGLATISEAVSSTIQNGGSVLFISYRELLTFHEIEAPLVPDYERVFLMEVAMAGDSAYLARFQDDLKRQTFDLIVSEPISISQKEGSGEFAAENNAWVKNISRPLLCYYEPVKTLRKAQIQLLIPAAEIPAHCR